MDRRTFVMGAAAIGAAALTGGMLGGCAGGEGAEPAVGSAPVEPSPMLEPPSRSRTTPYSRRTSLVAAAWAQGRGAWPGCATRRP